MTSAPSHFNRHGVTMTSRSQTLLRSGGRGFTLMELLVVIAIIGLLAALMMPVLAMAKERAIRIHCLNNIKQMQIATMIYAGDCGDKLPRITAGHWAWDVDWAVGTALLDAGMTKKCFYCPGTQSRFNDSLNFGDDVWSLWNYVTNNYHVLGYAVAFSGGVLNPTNQNTSMASEVNSQAGFPDNSLIPTNDRVLCADATLNEALDGSGSWTTVWGGYNIPSLTSHLKGTQSAGGNLGFKDGHAQWRSFKSMSERADSGPGFWW